MQPWTFKCFNWFRGRRARRLVSILQQAISINSRRLHFDSKHSTCSFVMSTSTMTSLLRFGKPLKSAGSRFRETEESCRHCKHEPSPEPNMWQGKLYSWGLCAGNSLYGIFLEKVMLDRWRIRSFALDTSANRIHWSMWSACLLSKGYLNSMTSTPVPLCSCRSLSTLAMNLCSPNADPLLQPLFNVQRLNVRLVWWRQTCFQWLDNMPVLMASLIGSRDTIEHKISCTQKQTWDRGTEITIAM
jgi:hypothetical protein